MAMTDLIARYRAAPEEHLADPLVLVPLAILDFLCIHPFQDGNGRMARLLTLQLLYHFDCTVGRFISLERIFEESKESYHETPEASSQGWHEVAHDIAPWLDYFWGALLRAYKEFEERVGTLARGRGAAGPKATGCGPKSSNAKCPSRSRRSKRLAAASAATWCGWYCAQ